MGPAGVIHVLDSDTDRRIMQNWFYAGYAMLSPKPVGYFGLMQRDQPICCTTRHKLIGAQTGTISARILVFQ